MSDPEAEPSSRSRVPVTDLVLGGVLLLIGVVLLVASAQLPAGDPTDPLGPRGFPTLLGVGFLASGAALLVRSAVAARRGHTATETDDGDDDDPGPTLRLRLLLAGVALVVYVFVLPTVGFLLTTPVFVAALLALQGGVARRPFVAMALGFPVAVYVLFAVILGVPLPPGVFDPMLLLGA